MNNTQHKQQGIVLIGVLIIVALISAIVTLSWQQQHKNFQTAQYTQSQKQALNYLYSIESWATVILLNDEDKKVDSLEEDWATDIPPIPIPGGQIQGKLYDLQARLSINNIVNINNPNNITLNKNFSRCLNSLNEQLEQDQMSDFIFAHISELFANNPNKSKTDPVFKHLSELKNIIGIQKPDYYKINPFLNALGKASGKDTAININTAGKEILSCLHPSLSETSVEEFIAKRPFSTVDKAKKALADASGAKESYFSDRLITVKTNYFILEATIEIEKETLNTKTIFKRESEGKIIKIINRTYQSTQSK